MNYKINMILALAIASTFTGVQAQKISQITANASPLVLRSQGSFYVGGENETQTRAELGGICPPGHITVNQMYVRYMIP